MALRYRITKRSNNIGHKNEQYILQAIHTGTIDLDMLSERISDECTLHSVDVKAVLIALGSKLDFYLKEGKIVDLGDVGKFKMGFKGTAEDKPELLSVKKNIQKFHVNYQPSLKLKRKLKAGVDVYKEGRK
ncbi:MULTISPECIES: DNA-binding protein [unclassified Polaribacter]|uniref:HU family DNA-binding protein n=1 Tax=unclassified Polaribacter TaxID=196858 RepID=UPI0011BF405F|nr:MULTISPECIES: DNA-binding protein [unclassified Polaribacter]TXD50610.1 DNA-binding protein [Polaribacter sp. IC063]TXD57273.1 DNA-binding protein [Polaribacter sp. IC066]